MFQSQKYDKLSFFFAQNVLKVLIVWLEFLQTSVFGWTWFVSCTQMPGGYNNHRRLHQMILILLGHDFQHNGVLPCQGLQGTVVNSLWTTDNDNHRHRSVLNFVTMINAVRLVIDSMGQKKRKTTIMSTNCYIWFFVRYLLKFHQESSPHNLLIQNLNYFCLSQSRKKNIDLLCLT